MSLFTLIVHPGERLLEQRPGRTTRALEPGRHWRRPGATYVRIDVRERLEQVGTQEVPTADAVAVKLSAVIRWAVGDAVAYVERVGHPLGHVYLSVQVALREALVDVDVAQAVVVARRDLGRTLTEAACTPGAEVGVDVREVVVNPALAKLRLVQALPYGAKLELTVDGD
jgi:regulator of protease activity HflC (stomatin/prohibitin superfamily)